MLNVFIFLQCVQPRYLRHVSAPTAVLIRAIPNELIRHYVKRKVVGGTELENCF